MKFAEVTGWVEQHPTESIVIGAGGLIAVLWLLGFFSSAPAASNSGASNLASAYYAAEAQQAVVGGQIQMATIQTAGATAQNAANANAAVAINKAQTKAATVINGQNASTTAALGNDSLLAAYSNNATALATVQSNNATAATINQSNNTAGIFQTILGTLMPAEIAQTGGYGAINVPGLGGFSTLATIPNLNQLMAGGLTHAEALQAGGLG